MIVYQAIKAEFQDHVLSGKIHKIIELAVQNELGRRTAQAEVSSWKNSLLYMDKVLSCDSIPDNAGVAVEYNIPQTGKRIDFIVSGKNSNNKHSAIIVELKQWQSASKTDQDGIVNTFVGGANRDVAHPSYQAWSYASLMRDFNENLHEDKILLHPCAYLHNFPRKNNEITGEFYAQHISNAPIYFEEDAKKLREFISSQIKHGDNKETIYLIESGRIRPSKALADKLSSMLQGNDEFTLIDDQKVVYEKILKYADKEGKHTLIIDGGPGTGKTVVAINALVKLISQKKLAQYVTKNAAPRSVYEAKLTGTFKKTHISNLFKGSGAYTESPPNTFEVLLADEAHRLNEKSGMYQNMGENQIKEIINASKCSVFFIDEAQKVSLKDIGEKEEIEHWAEELNSTVIHLKLESQFRCNGSDGYLAWLDNTLEIRPTANTTLKDVNYDFRVLDTPKELKELIEQKNKERNKARIVAGYCWDWVSKKDKSLFDIELAGFKAQWNLSEDGMLWILKEDSVKEVGCIHTCQGLEVDYIGVIIGEDLKYDGSKLVTDGFARSKNDSTIKGFKGLHKENPKLAEARADEIIKNTYRTLMTRGMKGCYVYCKDKKLSRLLRERISGNTLENPAYQK